MTESRVRLAQDGHEKELLKVWLSLFPSYAPEEHVEAIRGYIDGAPNAPIAVDLYVYERDDGRPGGFIELSLRWWRRGAGGIPP